MIDSFLEESVGYNMLNLPQRKQYCGNGAEVKKFLRLILFQKYITVNQKMFLEVEK